VNDVTNRPRTLIDALEVASRSTQEVVFVDAARRAHGVSYAELCGRARRAATMIRDAGVQAGDRVALFMRTSPAFFDALFGTMMLGAVPTPLYPPYRVGQLREYQAQTAQLLSGMCSRLVLTERRLAPLVRSSVEQGNVALGMRVVANLPDSQIDIPRLDPNAVAIIQCSSGTTGPSRGVRLTHRQILSNVWAIGDMILCGLPEEARARQVAASWLPLYHDMGLIGGAFTAMGHAAKLVLIPPEVFLADPAIWLHVISRHRVTVSPAPNFAFGYCADRIADADAKDLDLSSWRVAFNGAEAVTPSVTRRFTERFRSVGFRPEALTPVYGLSEAALIVAASPLERPPRFVCFHRERLQVDGVAVGVDESMNGIVLASVGRSVEGHEIEVRDERGIALDAGRVGRLWIRGPSLMEGYEGAANVVFDANGWFDTGDVGFFFDDELFLYARSKDLIIVRGRNYDPESFERAAEAVDGVRRGRSAAFGVPDEAPGTEGLVVLVERSRSTRRAPEAIAADVQHRVSEETGLRPQAVRVVAPGVLPRTSNGKVRRQDTRSLYLAGRVGRDRPLWWKRSVVSWIKVRLGRIGQAEREVLPW
jgi:acyl-CoA synthetase (AMP-forming)/AMP-acid ligase II